MSAIPKKKLCWNCEGSVAKQIDNCPYCGVYLHGTEPEEANIWNPSYTPSIDKESISNITTPFYSSAKNETIEELPTENETQEESKTSPKDYNLLLTQLKKDFLPIFFLMSGSIFLLFGLVLFLFSSNGTFTLQWNGDNWIYFLVLSIPFLLLGWSFLQKLGTEE